MGGLVAVIPCRHHNDASGTHKALHCLAHVRRTIVRAHVVAQTHIDHARLIVALGIVHDVAQPIGNVHISQLVARHGTDHQVGLGCHTVPVIRSVTAGGCAGGVSTVRHSLNIGCQ